MEKISLHAVLVAAYGIMTVYLYGAAICTIFGFRDRKLQIPQPKALPPRITKLQMAALVWPVVIGGVSLLLPPARNLESVMGNLTDVYSHVSFDCCFYTIPAIPAVGVLLLFKQKRWFYAAIPFVIAVIVMAVKIVSIVQSAKGNPSLTQ